MNKTDWLGVIIIYVLLYLLSRLVSYIGVINLFFYGDIILMVVILFIACCWYVSGGESLSDSSELRVVANIDTELDHKTRMDWIKKEYYELNTSIQDIANELGVSVITVRKWLDNDLPTYNKPS